MLYGLQAIGNNTPTTPQFNYIHQGLAYSGSMGGWLSLLGPQEETLLLLSASHASAAIPVASSCGPSAGPNNHYDNHLLKQLNLNMHR
jgi:hypothetical protein